MTDGRSGRFSCGNVAVLVVCTVWTLAWTLSGMEKHLVVDTKIKSFTKSSKEDVNVPSTVWFPDTNALLSDDTIGSKCSTLEDLQNLVTMDIPIPNNLHMVFLGDSLTRYQYLDLVYFLKYGVWNAPNNNNTPNLVLEKTHKGWNQFYNTTNAWLQPYETCDCFRKIFLQPEKNNFVENRYFYDDRPHHNNTVTYLQKMGNLPFHSNWKVSEIHHHNHSWLQHSEDLRFVVRGLGWVDTLKHFVCPMTPKPAFVVWNSGIWGHDAEMENTTNQNAMVQTLQDCGIRSVYKTTTKSAKETDSEWRDYEQELCHQTDLCYDVRWTGPLVSKENYWDPLHFLPPVYSLLNVQLLSLLLG